VLNRDVFANVRIVFANLGLERDMVLHRCQGKVTARGARLPTFIIHELRGGLVLVTLFTSHTVLFRAIKQN